MNQNFSGTVGNAGAEEICVDPLLTDREVGTELNCGRSTVWRWAADGTIPKPIKIGGLSRWRRSWIQQVIAAAEANRAAA